MKTSENAALSTKAKFLQNTLLFKSMSLAELEQLSKYSHTITKRKGDIIYHKQDYAGFLYCIQTGSVAETVFYGCSMDVIVKVRNRGDYLGETGILSDSVYPNTALALENTSLIAIPKAAFLDTLWSHTELCKVIISELIDRLKNSAQHMVNTMYLNAEGRLAFILINLTSNNGSSSMSIRITQNTLAASAGMARQTAAKIIGDWRSSGIISTERGMLKVLDPNALLEIILNSETEG